MTSENDYRTLQDLDRMSAGALLGVLNRNGAAHLTICPRCHVDDFVHVENCPLAFRQSETRPLLSNSDADYRDRD